MKRHTGESGQVLVMFGIALIPILLGAIGLAIDGSNLFAQRQVIQTAADAAAQAGMMGIFDGDGKEPSRSAAKAYALKNGAAGPEVDVKFSDEGCVAPGVPADSLSTSDPVKLTCVTITRSVNTTVMRLFGPAATTVTARATAAITGVPNAPPIVVLDPTAHGALSLQGHPSITITGGPPKSIQVNSDKADAVDCQGSEQMSLSGSLGVWGGGPSASPCTGVSGSQYVQPASPISDPLTGVSVAKPSTLGSSSSDSGHGCPVSTCTLYTPGLYTTSIVVGGKTAIFKPGLYYMNGVDFSNSATGNMQMATGFTDDPVTKQGMVVYLAGLAQLAIGQKNGTASLVGSPENSIYRGILFFQDRASADYIPKFGGNGKVAVTGTIYMPTQTLELRGGASGTTISDGDIIVDKLKMWGSGKITMTLNSDRNDAIRQVALVK